MGVFLMILKIIGISLAVLVGLILLIVLLVLFVPIRYKGSGEYPYTGNKLPADVHANISWLLHLVHISFDTTPDGQILRVKLFGFTIMTNDPEVVAKKAEKQKRKEEKRKAKEEKRKAKLKKEKAKAKKKADAKRRKMMDSQKQKHSNEQDKEFKKWSKEHKSTDNKGTTGTVSDSLGSLDRAYFDSDAVKKLKEEKAAEQNEASSDKKEQAMKPAKPGTKEYVKEHAGQSERHKKSEIYDENLKIFDDEDDEDFEASEEEDELEEKLSIFEKIGNKISGIIEKIQGIVEIPKKLYNKVLGILEKVDAYKEFAEDKRVQSGIKYVWKKGLLIIKRVLPKKLSGHCKFGMSDPATTGYIYGGACMFYGVWAKSFEITPDFEEKRLEADASFKGRIIIISLLIPGLKILLNKDVKYLRHKFSELKEDKSSEESIDSEE